MTVEIPLWLISVLKWLVIIVGLIGVGAVFGIAWLNREIGRSFWR